MIMINMSSRVKRGLSTSITCGSIALLGMTTSLAGAQSSGNSPVCWRPRPLEKCKTWVLTEAALESPVSSTSQKHLLVGYPNGEGYVSNDFEARLAFTLGLMKNTNRNSAFGLGVSMLNGDLPGRVEARYRRWLGPETGLDLGLGATAGRVRGAYDPDELPTRGITSSVGISGTYIGADARLEYGRTSANRPIHAAYLTIRTGSRAGPIVTMSGLLLYLGLFALATRGGDY
jgi:hypothetical protein